MAQKTKTQQPSETVTAEIDNAPERVVAEVQNMTEEEAARVVAIGSGRAERRVNALFQHNAAISDVVANKLQLMQEAEAAIEETVKLAGNRNDTEDSERAITEAAAKAGFLLYRGQVSGVLTKDEVTEMLGNHFGWKLKKDGEQSKTPFGTGENIRKRVVRAVNAAVYANGGDTVAFFDPLKRDAVSDVVNALNGGQLSIWQAFNKLADMKAEATGTRPKLHFDPRRIASIAAGLKEDIAASVKNAHDIPGLFNAYAALQRSMDAVFEEYSVAYPPEKTEAA